MGIEIPSSKDIKKLIRTQESLIGIEQSRLEIEEFIARILGAKPRAYFSSISTRDGITIKGEIEMAELKEGQQFVCTVSLTTKAGNPALYQTGSAAWASSNPSVASVTVDPGNELSATVAGLNGAANTPVLITFTADGDPNAEVVRDVVATLDVVVTQGNAFVASITPGTPTDTP